jgi:Mannosyltransferase putative
VTCAGGPRYFTCVWVLVRVLRELLKTSLPIEVWHRGAAEIDPLMRALLERHNVEMVDACALQSLPAERWALKPFAILHSRFEEVVFLDADNVPLIDPALVFEIDAYRETGALFWPDLSPLPRESPAWEACRVPYRDEPSFESGQLVLDKARSWKPLLLAMHMNERADFYYHQMHGDKDTFHMAWRFLERPYGMAPGPPRKMLTQWIDPLFHQWSFVLGQHDFQGRVIFQHRNWPKFVLFGRNPRYQGFVYEEECLRFLDDLAGLWDGRVARLDLPPPEEARRPGPSRWFRYVMVSDHERWIELRADQTIGYNSAQMERTWRAIPDGERTVLEILGDDYLTCRLTRQGDGVWRGRWLRYERCPVELIPLAP